MGGRASNLRCVALSWWLAVAVRAETPGPNLADDAIAAPAPADIQALSSIGRRPAELSAATRSRLFLAAAATLWHRVTADAPLIPAFATRHAYPDAARLPTSWLLDWMQIEADSDHHPARRALAALLIGVQLASEGRLADADVQFERCRRAQRPVLDACLAYAGMLGALVGTPERVAADWGAMSNRFRNAAISYGAVQTIEGNVGGQIAAVTTILRELHRITRSDETRLVLAYRPSMEDTHTSEDRTRRINREVLRAVKREMERALEHLPAGAMEKQLARAVFRRLDAEADLDTAATAHVRLAEAAAAGDWLAALWAAASAAIGADASRQHMPTLDLARRENVLASTLLWTLDEGPITDGPHGIRPLHGIVELALGNPLGAPYITPSALSSPRFHHQREAGRLSDFPEECRDDIQRFESAWRSCPANVWRTFTVLHPGERAPVAGAPTREGPYSALAAAARRLSGRCRQSIAARYPVPLAIEDLIVPQGTTLIDLTLSEGGTVAVTWLRSSPDGRPRLLQRHSFSPKLPERLRALLAPFASGSPSRAGPFSPVLAHELYEELFASVGLAPSGDSQVAEPSDWIVSMDLGAFALPVELLVPRETDCAVIVAGSDQKDVSEACRNISFIGDLHHVRYATDLRDALAWAARRPVPPPLRFVAVTDPVFFDDPDDSRCANGRCSRLPTAAARLRQLGTQGQRNLGRTLGMTDKPLAPVRIEPALLKRLRAGAAGAIAFERVVGSLGIRPTIHRDEDASEDAMLEALRNGGARPRDTMVYVATHLSVPEEAADRSGEMALRAPFGLVFAGSRSDYPLSSDGFLAVDDLQRGFVDASPVSLLALTGCSGARPIVDGVPPARSMASELRQAGVGTVLSYLWPVEDRVADRQMIEVLVGAAESAVSVDRALTSARRRWRRESPHPVHWASLVVLGPGDRIAATAMQVPSLARLFALPMQPAEGATAAAAGTRPFNDFARLRLLFLFVGVVLAAISFWLLRRRRGE